MLLALLNIVFAVLLISISFNLAIRGTKDFLKLRTVQHKFNGIILIIKWNLKNV